MENPFHLLDGGAEDPESQYSIVAHRKRMEFKVALQIAIEDYKKAAKDIAKFRNRSYCRTSLEFAKVFIHARDRLGILKKRAIKEGYSLEDKIIYSCLTEFTKLRFREFELPVKMNWETEKQSAQDDISQTAQESLAIEEKKDKGLEDKGTARTVVVSTPGLHTASVTAAADVIVGDNADGQVGGVCSDSAKLKRSRKEKARARKGTMSRAIIVGAAAGLHAASVTSALEDIERDNADERCSKVDTNFPAELKSEIAGHLSKVPFVLAMQIKPKKSCWLNVKLRLCLYYMEILIEGKNSKPIMVPYSTKLEIKTQSDLPDYPAQFILRYPDQFSYVCGAWGSVGLRDYIMLTMKAFVRKKYWLGEEKPTWMKPRPLWLKLNTHGVRSLNKKSIAVGGLIRDSLGDWITGFRGQVKIENPNEADGNYIKLLALKEGLLLALKEEIKVIEIEEYNFIVAILQKEHPNNYHLAVECNELLKGFNEYKLTGTEYSINLIAGLLASSVRELDDNDMVIERLDIPPLNVLRFFIRDKTGLPSYRVQIV